MSMTKPTSEQVTFKSQGIGAVTRTLQDTTSETISVKDFGAVGDGVADDTAAIQAAIDWAMYRNLPFNTSVTWNIPSVFIPAGKYKISDTIHLGYGDTFRSVHIRGDGQKYRGENNFAGTALITTFNDRPAMAISGGRSNSIGGITFLGLNRAWVLSNDLGNVTAPAIDDLVEANWVDPSFPASASSRYAPYCAIAVDPYAGPRPAVSYPDVSFPSWLNYTTQYQKNFSSDITIQDVEMTGFVVGLAVQPCDADGNGDFVKLEYSQVTSCQYGISVGNTQARDMLVDCMSTARLYCGITTGAHGRRNGKPAMDVRNSSFNFLIWGAICPNMSSGGTVAFRNCYSETMYGIGLFSAFAAGSGEICVRFDKCEFGFQSWIQRGIPRSPILAGCPVTFDGCAFATHPTAASGSGGRTNILVLGTEARQTSLRECTILAGANAQFLYEKQAINGTGALVVGQAQTNLASWSIRCNVGWNMSTGATISQVGNVMNQTSVPYTRTTCAPVYAKHVYCNDFDYGLPFPRLESLSNKATATSISQSGRTVTVNLTGSRTALSLATIGGDVGDIVVDGTTGTVFIVSSRTGATIEMVAQNNIDKNNDLTVTISLASGNFHYLMCRAFALGSVHYGDLSSSSATISNVVGADGVSRSVDSATAGVQAGDYALNGPGAAIGIASSSGSLVSSVTSNSIVLSGNARYTATRERMTYFVKQATANNT
jgi:hypothetical protein